MQNIHPGFMGIVYRAYVNKVLKLPYFFSGKNLPFGEKQNIPALVKEPLCVQGQFLVGIFFAHPRVFRFETTGVQWVFPIQAMPRPYMARLTPETQAWDVVLERRKDERVRVRKC